ncbi:hypothetical protein C5B85_12650 [Pseudoclavibacter sp. AY1F1]|uniref:hypothetical protein n=1 Tax=Pseudoclavibacter sp. AY1F1 TaxID=2080583 RepID=UPI000CE83874|nr:hypothetical protein [Pseudoclavibacter sp. AY1F1]PPF43544.1 hypothetical protein C5B85_12650 [Pseudoclavibacter sp. AY1F1]
MAAAAVVDTDIVAAPLWGGGGLYVQQPSTGAELTLVQSLRIEAWAGVRWLLPEGYADALEDGGTFWWTEGHSEGWGSGRVELLLAGIARLSDGWVVPLGGGTGQFSPL